MEKCDIGLIGLAVMGGNLALNIADKGYSVAVFNRTVETARRFMKERASNLPITHAETIEDLAASVKKPRTIIMMVKAGDPVDETIAKLVPLLDKGDLLMDLGNSHFLDTERRFRELEAQGIEYMGVGVSGGEQGALKGPSIMPGGNLNSYERVRPMLEAVAAKTSDGPCVTWLGTGGAGHFVKMVHNGLEYGDMQLIAEAYALLSRAGNLDAEALAKAFEDYNKGPLASYLIEITARIFREKDSETGKPLIDVILDSAGQKGTGRWIATCALEAGVPAPTITAAVEARFISAMKKEREQAEAIIGRKKRLRGAESMSGFIVSAMADALYASKMSLYAQGASLIKTVSDQQGYGLDMAEIARIWKGGCIIRSAMLDVIRNAYLRNPALVNLLLDPEVSKALTDRYDRWGNMVRVAIAYGVHVPAFSSSLMYFDGYGTARLPANLIQAQRDFFGAHTFERTDKEGTFHHEWPKQTG